MICFDETIIKNIASKLNYTEEETKLLYSAVDKVQSYSAYNEDFKQLYHALYTIFSD